MKNRNLGLLNDIELKRVANKNLRLLILMTIVCGQFLLSSILKNNTFLSFLAIGSFIPCNALYLNYTFAKRLMRERATK
jgi:hypothetical protein